MKKLLMSTLLALLVTACAQTDTPSSGMKSGAMCEKGPCCQKMMGGAAMKNGKMKCPMMSGDSKDGKKCPCCQKMMEDGAMKDGMMQNGKDTAEPVATPTPAKAADSVDHTKHHPAK